MGFVFQAYNLLARNTTLENVEMPLVYSGLRKSKRKARAQAALERVGLGHRIKHWPSQLSGGQQQRVAIARALVGDPALILADEPTGNLDPDTADSVLQLLRAEIKASAAAAIMVTHSHAAAQIADKVLILTRQGLKNVS